MAMVRIGIEIKTKKKKTKTERNHVVCHNQVMSQNKSYYHIMSSFLLLMRFLN